MKTAAAPTIQVKITHNNKTLPCTVLPDSGADICAAGADFLGKIGMKPDQLNDSKMRPEAVNGQRMKPLGSIDVMIEFMGRHVQEMIHVYRGDYRGVALVEGLPGIRDTSGHVPYANWSD